MTSGSTETGKEFALGEYQFVNRIQQRMTDVALIQEAADPDALRVFHQLGLSCMEKKNSGSSGASLRSASVGKG